jgi:SAM-dependent methyltransferase
MGNCVGDYSLLASEYYDPIRHPTCANFRTASELLISSWLDKYLNPSSSIVEVGAGRSVAAEHVINRKYDCNRLTITDSSAEMLAHSSDFSAFGAILVQSDASHIPKLDATTDIIVASLGDPYNRAEFWSDACRVLRRGGVVLFTTPSYEWALHFRYEEPSQSHKAAFKLANGHDVLVQSDILVSHEQIALIESVGLTVAEVTAARVSDLNATQISAKLLYEKERDLPIVTGYVAAKL